MVLISISLTISDVEHLFMYLLVIWMTSLEKNVHLVLLPIFNWIAFLLLSCMSSLYILDITPLIWNIFCKILFPLLLLFSHSDMPDTLRPHGLQHARLPCLSLFPRSCSNSCPLVSDVILSSVVPFSCLQSLSASGSFLMSQLFTSCGQSIGASFQWIVSVDFL